ncbi:hypothetical protein BKA62DRAFT_668274 [Auriculariales sp. MPI-PUGE-AT-0066]|nr:hypothetical protein BKA62DRAFT_668274 [Auriculariales sp. MPI-PUGE-AT-0066]
MSARSKPTWRRAWLWMAGSIAVVTALAVLGLFIPSSKSTSAQMSPGGECPRVIIHQFDNAWGFGSEFGIFLRAAAISAALKAPVLANSTKWIYGDLHHFFRPRELSDFPCVLPQDVAYLATGEPRPEGVLNLFHQPFNTKNWGTAARVDIHRDMGQLGTMDRLVREASINTTLTAALKEKEHWYSIDTTRMTLPYGESVQPELYESFLQQVQALDQMWRPTPIMQAQIDRLARRIELPPDSYQKSTGRRPVVILQIRLGDKWSEQTDVLGAGTHMKYDDLEAYYEAARLALTRLYDSNITPSPRTFPMPPRQSKGTRETRTSHRAYPPIISRQLEEAITKRANGQPVPKAEERKRPLLVIMSAEANVLQKIHDLDVKATGMYGGEAGGVFDVVQSPSYEFTADEETEFIKIFGKINAKVYRPTNEDSGPLEIVTGTSSETATASPSASPSLTKRWTQSQLYSASEGLRLALSRQLIAELTVYSRMADAFVGSGNSNLGRMALIIGGVEASIGYGATADLKDTRPITLARRQIGGRIRSIDVPFYPTAYRSAIFG